jgi:hypothetical protein
MINIRFVEERLGTTFATASKLVRQFEDLGLLHEVTGGLRSRRFLYAPYVRLFSGSEWEQDDTPIQITEVDQPGPTANK